MDWGEDDDEDYEDEGYAAEEGGGRLRKEKKKKKRHHRGELGRGRPLPLPLLHPPLPPLQLQLPLQLLMCPFLLLLLLRPGVGGGREVASEDDLEKLMERTVAGALGKGRQLISEEQVCVCVGGGACCGLPTAAASMRARLKAGPFVEGQ